MAKKKVYRFNTIARAEKRAESAEISGHSPCPGKSTRPALRSLLSVALSSVRVLPFYYAGTFLPLQ